MLKLYDFLKSGNCYKVRLLLSHLGLPYERIEISPRLGETRQASYLAINPSGQIPLLMVDGIPLAESSAILFYLAEGSTYLPASRLERAQCVQWMSFEQAQIFVNLGVSRRWITMGQADQHEAELVEKQKLGHRALTVMETKLEGREFFVGNCYSIADISLFAYTHTAEEGLFKLEAYPRIREWIGRVKAQSGFVAM